MDNLTKEQRSAQMRLVRSANTKPEIAVRKLVYNLGYRYRLHPADVPGRPDIALKSRKKAIFVNGCFWHRHACTAGQRVPKSKAEFWLLKFEKNIARDAAVRTDLRKQGWRYCVIWECGIKDETKVLARIRKFLHARD
jgi:DNA mismatch endonuclease (patch repair protein)